MSGIRARAFFLLILCGAFASPARADLKVLFEITLDVDHDGKMDRAVLALGEGTGSYGPNKEWYMLGADGRVDLHVYLGAGDAPLDLSRKPSFVKKDIVRGERQNQIFPLKARNGSLIVKTAYNLYSNWVAESLTIVHRKGEFLVAGFSRSIDMKSGDQRGCDINFLTGKGLVSKRGNGGQKSIGRRFAPVRLGAWEARRYLKFCER